MRSKSVCDSAAILPPSAQHGHMLLAGLGSSGPAKRHGLVTAPLEVRGRLTRRRHWAAVDYDLGVSGATVMVCYGLHLDFSQVVAAKAVWVDVIPGRQGKVNAPVPTDHESVQAAGGAVVALLRHLEHSQERHRSATVRVSQAASSACAGAEFSFLFSDSLVLLRRFCAKTKISA